MVKNKRTEEARRKQKKGINITWREEDGTAYPTVSPWPFTCSFWSPLTLFGLFSFLARLRNVMPEGSCVKARPLAEVGPRLGRARTVGLDVSAMVPRTWTPQQMECAARHGRPSRCHRGRLWRDGILGCQAQRCSVTAQPGGATLHPLSHHTGMRVYGPLQPWLVVPVAGGQRGGNRAPTPLVGRCAPLLVERSFTLGCVPHHWVATSSTPPAGCCGVFLPPGRRAR